MKVPDFPSSCLSKILLGLVFLLSYLVVNSNTASTPPAYSQSTQDFEFLNRIGLPWHCREKEPRYITKSWIDHWDTNPPSAGGVGIDFNAPGSTDHDIDVLAPFGGTVTSAGWHSAGYGNVVTIDAGNGWSVLIAHLHSVSVDEGSGVALGQVIGRSDNTGDNTTGDHIHLELRWNGNRPNIDWFGTNGNLLFGYRTEDYSPARQVPFYSNNCGTGPTTTLYSDANSGGHPVRFFGLGRFRVPDWFNDQASSLAMEEGVSTVTVYEHAAQQGGAITFYQDDSNFDGDRYNAGAGPNVNDTASSLWIGGSRCRVGRNTSPSVNIAPACIPGDLNGDGQVNILDYSILFDSFNWTGGEGAIPADITENGRVNLLDYSLLYYNFGASLTTASTLTSSRSSSPEAPVPPSDVMFSTELNDNGTATIVHLRWIDNADDEESYAFTWEIPDYEQTAVTEVTVEPPPPPGSTQLLRPVSDDTSSVLAVLPCGSADRTYQITASVSAYNSSGASVEATGEGTITIPACSTVFLPSILDTQSPTPDCSTDNFNQSSLDTGWVWIDPLGDSSFSLTDNPGNLRLSTPDRGHDLYPYSNLNAPRLMRDVTGDFQVVTKVTIDPRYNYQGAGLLLWQDENNYVRLERTLVEGVDLWYRINGSYSGFEVPYSSPSVYLKLERSGSSVLVGYSLNGQDWIVLPTLNVALADNLQVGISLLNEWQDNPIWADFDFFSFGECS